MKVDTSLSIGYFGGEYAARKGFFEGHLSRGLFDSVQQRFAHFLHQGPVTPNGTTDLPDVEFYVRKGDVVNHFRGNAGHLTEADAQLLYWFVGLVEQADGLRPCEHIPLHTTYQTEPDFLRQENQGVDVTVGLSP